MARFIPGVLGHEEAAGQDSFQEGIFDAPHYTRPEVFEQMPIPEVLKTGNHAEIAKWRGIKAWRKQSGYGPIYTPRIPKCEFGLARKPPRIEDPKRG